MVAPSPAGRFIMLEPSKVGSQHVTLLEGWLRALHAIDLPARGLELVYRADSTSFAALAEDVRVRTRHEPITVLDPEQRRWVRKVFQELRAVRQSVADLGPRDLLLITCLSSPTLFLLELGNALLGTKNVTAVLHGEVEALFDFTQRDPRRWGFWAWAWARLRRPGSRLRLAVIARFIADSLAKWDPVRFGNGKVRVLPFPVLPASGPCFDEDGHLAIFIGYRTRFKGYDRFVRIAQQLGARMAFAAVGGGVVEAVPGGQRRPIDPRRGYHGEVARASVAIFPYSAGYVAGLSAAALDALATGVHILATPRPCFVALRDALGPDHVTLFETEAEAAAILDGPFLDRVRAGAESRRRGLARSPFGSGAAEAAFAAMCEEAGHRALAGRLAA